MAEMAHLNAWHWVEAVRLVLVLLDLTSHLSHLSAVTKIDETICA